MALWRVFKMVNSNSVKRIIDKKMQGYDANKNLVVEFHTPNYHSNLNPGEYCFINTSTKIVAAIFSCEYDKYYSIANDMLRKIVALQCKSGENAGLWPYYLEETIEEMVAPDHNYADFNAYPMLYILKEHKDKFDDDLYGAIGEACILACKAIVRRNPTIIYTNPTVMGIYCTALCGEIFGIDEFIEYGRNKLNKFYYRIMNAGTYDEYNCPEYSMLIANIYALILRHIEDTDMHNKAVELNHILWMMLGEHYHKDMDEFTGPNLRQYVNFSDTADLKNAVGLKKDGEELLSLVYKTECPEDVMALFTQEGKNADFRRVLSTGYIYPYLGYPMVDTQHIRPKYTLGSFSMDDCWNQRRNVVSYIGNKEKKVCIRLRTYHNDYDFCSAFTSTAQNGNVALSLTNFHTNRGDTHVDLDPVKDATIKVTKLRVLYQIEANCEGIIENIKTEKTENGCELEILGTMVEIEFPFIEATGLNPHFEITVKGKEMYVEAFLYSGEERNINLNSFDSLAVISVLSIGDCLKEKVQIAKDEDLLIANLKVNETLLTVKGPYKPLKQAHSVLLNEVLINNINIIKLAEEKS